MSELVKRVSKSHTVPLCLRWCDPACLLVLAYRRKQKHIITCVEWREQIATWEEEWQQEEMMIDAREMLLGPNPNLGGEDSAAAVPSWQA